MLAQAGRLDFLLRDSQIEVKQWWENNGQEISVFHAHRGFGKTWFALVLALECAARGGNRRIVYAAPSREQARKIVVPTMQLLQERLEGALDIRQISSTHQWRIVDTNSVLIIEGADDDNGDHLRGPFAHLGIGDEVGFWRQVNYPLRSVLYPVVKRRKGRILVLSTSPESVGHEFVGLCGDAIANGGYIKRTLDDNRDLTDKEKEDYIREIGGKQGRKSSAVKRELYCEFVIEAERAVVPEFDEATHVGEVEAPPYRDRYMMIDLGFDDLTHSLYGYWHFEKACLVIEDEIAENRALTPNVAKNISAKEKSLWGDHRPFMRIADNDPQIIADLAAYGIYCSPTLKTDKEAAINSLRKMFEDNKILIHPRCQNLIFQLKVGVWNKHRTDYERILGAGHLDGIDALVYGNRMLNRNHNPAPANLGYHVSTHFIPPSKTKSTRDKLLKIVGGY